MEQDERVTRVVRQLRGGQITIPASFRRKLGIERDSLLQMTLAGGWLQIRLMQTPRAADSTWFQQLYASFAPLREEAEKERYSEEEINQAIDEALAAVRRKHA